MPGWALPVCGVQRWRLRATFSFQKINEKPQVIADYESGRAIPNNQVMGKIERAIGERRSAGPAAVTVLGAWEGCLGGW